MRPCILLYQLTTEAQRHRDGFILCVSVSLWFVIMRRMDTKLLLREVELRSGEDHVGIRADDAAVGRIDVNPAIGVAVDALRDPAESVAGLDRVDRRARR